MRQLPITVVLSVFDPNNPFNNIIRTCIGKFCQPFLQVFLPLAELYKGVHTF